MTGMDEKGERGGENEIHKIRTFG